MSHHRPHHGRHPVHSLHLWHGGGRQPAGHRPVVKGDRLLVGIASGALIFYLVGKALGLGRGNGRDRG